MKIVNSIKETTKDIISNIKIIYYVSRFNVKIRNNDTYLGGFWSILTPLIQIGTYWFVFGVGLRSGKDVNGIPYLVWMIVGIVPWFYISSSIIQGSNSIFSNINLLSKIKLPFVIIPLSKVLEETYSFLISLIITCIIIEFNNINNVISWFSLMYYIIYSVSFLMSFSLITSVLVMLARDFYKLLVSAIKLIFYITPILWTMDNMPNWFKSLTCLNPIYYICNGFRESLLFNVSFYKNKTTIIMVLINIVVYILGSILQKKYKHCFIDLI